MPIYMDRHELDEPVTQKELAMAHYQDLLIQDQFDAKSMTYWQSEDGKTAFCLIDAPNPEALKKMHAASHGLIPHKIIEVDPEEVLSILGRITDPTGVKDLDKYEENVDEYAADHGSPFRVIMFTDLKDSTLMQTELGEEKALEMLRTHNELIRTAIKPHNGQEVKHTGDGLMISYLNVSDALEGGASIQAAFDEHNQNNPDDAMYVRIGFSAGEPVFDSNDFFGLTVNLASRLCDHSEPGSVLVSTDIQETKVDGKYTFTDLGNALLKGFKDAVQVFRVSQ